MSWLKLSLYIFGVLIVIFGGALVLDRAAPILRLTKWLPNEQHTWQQIELQFYDMWLAVEQLPPEDAGRHVSTEKSTR